MVVTTQQSVNPAAGRTASPMNKGIHWEWRAFGVLSEEHRIHIEKLCTTPLQSSDVTDKYLWGTGSEANIKIRRKTLKFKNLLKTTGDGFELWEEGPHLKYKFPLDRSAIDLLESKLCVKAPEIIRSGCNNIDDLIAATSFFEPPMKLIQVKKHRSRCLFSFDDIPLQLEIADIVSPLTLTSIAIECGFSGEINEDRCLYYMREARNLLELPDSFRIMGYMLFLDDLAQQGFF